MRRINDEGLSLIKQWEGCRLTAYRCPAGVWTIGYGSTGPHVSEGMTITETEAEDLLRRDLERFERVVDQTVKVTLTDNQFAALVSLAFNIGSAAFAGSTLVRKLNGGDYDAVPAELARWNRAGGKRLEGLANRRAAEAGLWARGSFVVSAGPTTAEPERPRVLTRENLAAGSTVAGSLGFALTGDGPIQWALGVAILIAVCVGGYLFLKKRLRPT